MPTDWIVSVNVVGSYDVISRFPSGEYVVARDMPIEDAALTAAAPDMFRALERIVSSVARCASGDVCQTSEFDDARAALAKARGEPVD